MLTKFNLLGGMASVLSPETCPPDKASLIENMRLGSGASWEAIHALQESGSDEFANILKVFEWTPSVLPTAIKTGDTSVLICFSATTCYAYYRTVTLGVTTWTKETLLTGVSGATVRAAADSVQVIFVDGRANLPAQRVYVDTDRTIHCAPLGMAAPTHGPEIASVEVDPTSAGEHTLLPSGASLYYCFCAVNVFGERSNPSPVTVYDRHHRFIKGEYILDEYEYSSSHTGEITAVQVSCAIDDPEMTERIELYRGSAEYTEGSSGMGEMMLIRSVETLGQGVVTITDSVPASVQAVDNENDLAPAGDEIALSGGMAIIGNAVSQTTFPGSPAKVWRITLTNTNSRHYSNQWIRLVLHDEAMHAILTSQPYLEGLTAWPATAANYRLLDSDRITTLNAYHYPDSSTLTDITASPVTTGIVTRGLFLVQIPYIPALMSKDIYLIEETGANVIAELTTGDDYMDTLIDNPVRTSDVIYAGKTSPIDLLCNYTPLSRNRANAFNDFSNLTIGADHSEIHFDGYVLRKMTGREGIWFGTATSGDYTRLVDIESDRVLSAGGHICVGIKVTANTPYDNACRVIKLNSGDGTADSNVSILFWRDETTAYCIARLYDNRGGDNVHTYCVAQVSLESGLLWGDYVWLYLSWGKAFNDGNSIVTPFCAAIIHSLTDAVGATVKPVFGTSKEIQTSDPAFTTENYYLTDRATLTLTIEFPRTSQAVAWTPEYILDGHLGIGTESTLDSGTYSQNIIGIYAALGEYIDDPYEIMALHLWEPLFPNEPIGFRGTTTTVSGTQYAINHNVSIEELDTSADNRPGRIRWSRGAAVPELNERTIADEIVRLAAMRSFMPTLEHNTILAFTTSGQVIRILMDDDTAIPTTEMTDMHLASPDALLVMGDRLIWATDTDIYMYSASGTQGLSQFRIPMDSFRLVANPTDHEVLFIPTTGTDILVYDIANDVWTARDYGSVPLACIRLDGEVQHISTTGKLLQNAATYLTSRILTGGIPAMSRIRRITVRGTTGDTYSILARVHHHRDAVDGYTDTTTYAGTANVPMAIPNLRGEIVQFDITGLQTLKYIDIEDTNAN